MRDTPTVLRAVELLESGMSSTYVREKLLQEFKQLKPNNYLDQVMKFANDHIEERCLTNVSEIAALHLSRLNQIIEDLLATEELDFDKIYDEESMSVNGDGTISYETGEHTYDQWAASRLRKELAYKECIDTMIHKEECLQFHKKDFVYEFNEVVNEVTVERRQAVNIEKLVFDEQVELYNLVKKARLGEQDLISITNAQVSEQIVTEDVAHVVVDTATNAQQIEHKEIPPVPHVSPNSAFDPAAAMRERLKKLVTKQYQDAGFKLDDQEKKLLE